VVLIKGWSLNVNTYLKAQSCLFIDHNFPP